MSDPMARAAQLLAPMLKHKLFVIFWLGKGADLKPLLADHLQYMIEVEASGRLLASGPLGDPRESNGMTIVKVATEEEAREIAQGDPFVGAGLRSFRIEPWTIMEGSIGLTLTFSNGTISLK